MSRLVMTIIIVLVVVGIGLAATGVLSLRNTKDETSVTIDKKQLKTETREAVEKTEAAGGKILDKTGDALHKAAERMRGPADDRIPPMAMPPAHEANPRQPDGGKTPPDNK